MEATWDGEVIGKQQNILCCDYSNCDKHLIAKENCIMSYQCYELSGPYFKQNCCAMWQIHSQLKETNDVYMEGFGPMGWKVGMAI